jgi:hypothetical protein
MKGTQMSTQNQTTGSLTLPLRTWIEVFDLASPDLTIHLQIAGASPYSSLEPDETETTIDFSGFEALEIEARNLSGAPANGGTS